MTESAAIQDSGVIIDHRLSVLPNLRPKPGLTEPAPCSSLNGVNEPARQRKKTTRRQPPHDARDALRPGPKIQRNRVALVAGEQLITAIAGKDHFDVLPGESGDQRGG